MSRADPRRGSPRYSSQFRFYLLKCVELLKRVTAKGGGEKIMVTVQSH